MVRAVRAALMRRVTTEGVNPVTVGEFALSIPEVHQREFA